MPVGTVVLTPGAAYAVDPHVVLDLSGEDPPMEEWAARTALGIHQADPAGPLLLVISGPACAQAPHLGFAQRAARRSVAGYVLVDPALPRPGAVPDWPDAPVVVVVTPNADADTRTAALGARLRGWEVREGDAESAIREIAREP
ncbi:MAG: hypothetical protein ACR2KE_05335 [Candidatus Nanopelagicales bacterium]